MESRRNDWWNRTPNRRTFLRGASAAGLAAATVGLVGCGDDDDEPGGGSQTPGASASPSETPKSGGTLRGAQTADLNMSTGYPFVGLAENPYINWLPVETAIRYRGNLEP